MKNILLLTICIFLSGTTFIKPFSGTSDTDSLITSVISHVNSDSIKYAIQNLQNFQTRFMLTPNRFNSADWIENRFHEIGITDVERDSFMCHTTYMVDTTTLQINVIATIPGTTRPEEVYIIGGHYDCFAYGDPFNSAPGADDNASGASSALEFARALLKSGYQPEATIKFITFAAEELMLFGDAGCRHYAQRAVADSMNIKLMINCDMISNTESPLEQSSVHINFYSGFESLLDFALNVTQQFSLISPLAGQINQQSDSYPFYEQGFPAIYFEENDFSSFYHTIGDTIGNYDMDFCREVVKSAGATLLKYMIQGPTGNIDEPSNSFPDKIHLYQNYPNPFNPVTLLAFDIIRSSFVTLKVYDVLGNEVALLVNEEKLPGQYKLSFNAGSFPSGVYFYRLQTDSYAETKKMILLR